MKYLNFLILTIWATLFISCNAESGGDENMSFKIKELELNSLSGGCSNLFVDESGKAFLTWIEYLNDTTDALMWSALDVENWSDPQKIAQGSNWFVNWADFPALAVFPGGDQKMAAHWLQKSAQGTYDYDVRVSISGSEGEDWAPSFILHRDSIAAEHGFVSLMPSGADRILAVWLDGRFTKQEGGAMTLRSGEFDREGNLYEESELDHRICDCCQTDVVMTANGPVAVYRDRSDTEIRDIYIVRQLDGQWTDPEPVFADNWMIPGCPVNGPAVAAHEHSIAVAWFTAPENEPAVKIAFSDDGGANFEEPYQLDNGNPLGRVDIIMVDEKKALVSWLEKTEDNAEIRLQWVSPDGPIGESIAILETAHSRESGFPIMERAGGRLILSYTEVDTVGTRVKTVEVLY
ncbi:MAG: hypothetical protein DWQ02_17585 [Bacteroidetes bacterium]|nr:MAG: hypothetical protein DWQ02_17585 [Bacteroidota bacterium]